MILIPIDSAFSAESEKEEEVLVSLPQLVGFFNGRYPGQVQRVEDIGLDWGKEKNSTGKM